MDSSEQQTWFVAQEGAVMSQSLKEPVGVATIYDVATRAGVSISTVSRALNAPTRVAAATLDRVYGAVQELGFELRADAAARARKQFRRVGVRGQFISHGSFFDRLRGVLAAAQGDDCEVVLYDEESHVHHLNFVESLSVSNRLDGIILMGVPLSQALARRLAHETFKTVTVVGSYPGLSSVNVDEVEGGRLAATYLVERGHRRCAYLGNRAGLRDSAEVPRVPEAERLDGFREGLGAAGIALPDDYVLSQHALPTARDAAHHLLALEQPPTAIFACADDLAVEVLKAARERGVRVPDDVAVIGFDDREYADYLGLTTVRQPLYESGQVAYRLLQESVGATSPGATTTVTLPLTVVPRDTA
jgi:LacI family transcriptional regulator